MGYVIQPPDYLEFSISDDIIIQNVGQETTSSTAFVKVKAIQLIDGIQANSTFRIKCGLWVQSGATAYAILKRNGVTIGVQWSSASVTELQKIQDLPGTLGWQKGDELTLWLRTNNQVELAVCNHFMICGVGSHWNNTLV
jgi:hypothetical protein